MAIYHLSVKPIQRSKGQSATAAAAYRAGEKLKDERIGDVHDYTRKRGIEHSEILTPNGGSINRERLWNLAELAEKRKDGTPAREYEISLPDELDEKQRLELARSFAEYLAGHHGCVVDLSIHAPGKEGDHRNHHAHLLCTTRRFEPGGGLGGKCDVELSDRDRAKKGLPGRKTELAQTREHWERLANRALEKSGHTARIDHKSLEAQGVKRNPGIHIGATATAMERSGVSSDRGRLHCELTQGHQKTASTRAELTAAERIEAGLTRVKDKVKNYQATQARQREIERTKLAELTRQREIEVRSMELARQRECDQAKAAKEAEIKAKLEQEEKAKLQKEKQEAEKAKDRSRRCPGMGR